MKESGENSLKVLDYETVLRSVNNVEIRTMQFRIAS